jgi:hypothetical protein
MVRPQINLDTYKDEITALFNQQNTNQAICLELAQRYSIDITQRTLPGAFSNGAYADCPQRHLIIRSSASVFAL